MKFLYFIIILFSLRLNGAIIEAISGYPTDVSNACVSATSWDIVVIPAGTFLWTNNVTWNPPANVTLLGAGNLTTTGGGDATVIIDDFNSSSPLLNFTVSSTGVFRMAGITVRGSTNYLALKTFGEVYVAGGVVRIDHCTFDTSMAQGKPILLVVNGVMSQCKLLLYNVGPYALNGAFDTVGNESQMANITWSHPTAFGSSNFFFIEDSLLVGVTNQAFAFGDGWTGCRLVYRFNTIQGGAGFEGHTTGHAGDNRGVRATEGYGNLYTNLLGQSGTPANMGNCAGGPSLLWGNKSTHNNGITFYVTRKDSTTYPEVPIPDSWGYAGGAPIATGTVNVINGTNVTWVSGDNFNTSWPSGSMIWIEDSSCEAFTGQAPGRIDSGGIGTVNSTTSITLTNGGTDGGDLMGVRYAVGSPWDGNTDPTGYPAIDQPGRGQGDLLVGAFPDKTNAALGGITWPRQALEPIYIWSNTNSGGGVTYGNNSGGRVVANRDYYPQASGIQTSPTSPFDGTSGTGWGTLANRPTTCTTGVAYWATDQGNWNNSTTNPYGVQMNGADGVLYVATAEDTWTLYYTPYTYPHPLTIDSPRTIAPRGVIIRGAIVR